MLNPNCCIQRSSNSADLLCQLVHGAQENDQKAINELCERFTPLIRKIANNSYYKDHLGEDAENIAWVIFLEFIKRYNGNDFVHLPGLLQIHLRYKLLRICKHGELRRLEIPLIGDEDNQKEIIDSRNYICDFEIRQMIIEIIGKLSPRQRVVLTLVFLEGKTLKEISKILNISYEAARSVYRRGLACMKILTE